MNEIVIRVENLFKQYRLGTINHGMLYKDIQSWWAKKRGKEDPHGRLNLKLNQHASDYSDQYYEDYFWALKNISFEVKKGDVLGIIGRNGAGKSTLLKVLSKITAPTTGSIKIKGRIASLLEVGTGFHPELTGRENVFLNGAILGMIKREIKNKFDEIVDFAEIGQFIDTPVKRYSSGMYVRLAFAVAAFLEPEILLVDEVLAVGDIAFQKKCLGKMGDVAKEGRTVLFVSHNMLAINQLCQNVMLLSEGRIEQIGETSEIISTYLSKTTQKTGEYVFMDESQAPGDENIRLRAIRIKNLAGEITSNLDIRYPFSIEIEYKVFQKLPDIRIGFRVITLDGIIVFTSANSCFSPKINIQQFPGIFISKCEIPGNLLNDGQYTLLNVWADIPHMKVNFVVENVLSFHIERIGGVSGQYIEKRWSGVICPFLKWEVKQLMQ